MGNESLGRFHYDPYGKESGGGSEDQKRKEDLAKIDEKIANRARGRVINGEVVPFEKIRDDLKRKKEEHGGILSTSEEATLNDLTLRLEGSLMERSGRPKPKK